MFLTTYLINLLFNQYDILNSNNRLGISKNISNI
nr:MAG TPA: hypothetical protein [Caudoviricetes sp.]